MRVGVWCPVANRLDAYRVTCDEKNRFANELFKFTSNVLRPAFEARTNGVPAWRWQTYSDGHAICWRLRKAIGFPRARTAFRFKVSQDEIRSRKCNFVSVIVTCASATNQTFLAHQWTIVESQVRGGDFFSSFAFSAIYPFPQQASCTASTQTAPHDVCTASNQSSYRTVGCKMPIKCDENSKGIGTTETGSKAANRIMSASFHTLIMHLDHIHQTVAECELRGNAAAIFLCAAIARL